MFNFRCIVASKDIEEAELIFIDTAVITGPMQDSVAQCLGCYASLDSWDYYKCTQ